MGKNHITAYLDLELGMFFTVVQFNMEAMVPKS